MGIIGVTCNNNTFAFPKKKVFAITMEKRPIKLGFPFCREKTTKFIKDMAFEMVTLLKVIDVHLST